MNRILYFWVQVNLKPRQSQIYTKPKIKGQNGSIIFLYPKQQPFEMEMNVAWFSWGQNGPLKNAEWFQNCILVKMVTHSRNWNLSLSSFIYNCEKDDDAEINWVWTSASFSFAITRLFSIHRDTCAFNLNQPHLPDAQFILELNDFFYNRSVL